jgi:hypothetical protein
VTGDVTDILEFEIDEDDYPRWRAALMSGEVVVHQGAYWLVRAVRTNDFGQRRVMLVAKTPPPTQAMVDPASVLAAMASERHAAILSAEEGGE